MAFPLSHQVSGLFGFESKKYIFPFIYPSIAFPVHVMTLEKWTKEVYWPAEVAEATLWVCRHETIFSHMRCVNNSRACGVRAGGYSVTRAGRRGRAWGPGHSHLVGHPPPPRHDAQHDAESLSEASNGPGAKTGWAANPSSVWEVMISYTLLASVFLSSKWSCYYLSQVIVPFFIQK